MKVILLYILFLGITINLNADILLESHEACSAGDPGACYNLGNMYSMGKGVKHDNAKAKKFYFDACNKGSARACYALGLIFSEGTIVQKNITKAKSFFEKSCNGSYTKGCKEYKTIKNHR